MIRQIAFSQLANERLCVEVTEITAQIWAKNAKWTGYEHTPRKSDGFSLFVSPVSAIYRFADGNVLTAKQGDAVYIPAGARYTVCFEGGGASPDLYTVNFRLEDDKGNAVSLGEAKIFSGAVSPVCLDAARELTSAFLFDKSLLKKQTHFFRLLDGLLSRLSHREENYYAIRKGARLLAAEWMANEKISRYAEACGMSESNFYARFKAWSGKSPVHYRNTVRVNAAKALLESSNLSVADVAERTGFDDPYYFTRLFKKIVGVSPTEYRKNGSF